VVAQRVVCVFRALLPFLLLTLGACGPAPSPREVPKTWCGGSREGCESQFNRAFGDVARRLSDSAFAIRLSDGRETVIEAEGCGGPCGYLYPIYYFKERGFLLVGVSQLGPRLYLLVDDRTGRSIALGGLPIFSSDGRAFVVSIGDQDSPNGSGGFEIWSLETGSPVRVFRLDEPQSFPFDGTAVWLESDRIQLRYTSFAFDPDRKRKQVDIVVRQNGVWMLDGRRQSRGTDLQWQQLQEALDRRVSTAWSKLDLGIVRLTDAGVFVDEQNIDTVAFTVRVGFQGIERMCRLTGLEHGARPVLQVWLSGPAGMYVIPLSKVEALKIEQVDLALTKEERPTRAAIVPRARCTAKPGRSSNIP
jgi:hypothetical protein